jgi:uncharacterized lipoprotein YmbA
MKRRLLLLAVPLAACATTPPLRYYRVAVSAGATRAGTGARLGVRAIGLPQELLTQPALPAPSGPYALNTSPNDLWAGPLAAMLQAAMVQDLQQRLPADTVLADGGAVGAPADKLVEIEVFALGVDETGLVTLSAQLAVRPAATPQSGWQLRNFGSAAPGGTTPEGVAAAISTLWGEAADQLAGMV